MSIQAVVTAAKLNFVRRASYICMVSERSDGGRKIKLHSQRSPDNRERSKKPVSPYWNVAKRPSIYMALSLTLVTGLVLVGISNGSSRISHRSTRSSKTVPIKGVARVISLDV